MITDHPVPTLSKDPTAVSKLDPDAYRAAFTEAVEEGLASLKQGKCITLEEMEKEFSSWIIK